jgi:hypothetical protein
MTGLGRWLEDRAARLPSGVGPVLLSDAAGEVDGFLRPVTERALDQAVAGSTDVSRYRVVRRALYRRERSRPHKPWFAAMESRFEKMVTRLLALVPADLRIPDFDFAANLGDYPVKGAPILTSWSREGYGNARLPSVVHWPTDLSVDLDDGAIRAHYAFEPEAVARPWSARVPRVGWRGSATGMYDRTFRWSWVAERFGVVPGRGVPRLTLCRTSAEHPDLVDARITGWPQLSDGVRARLERVYPTAPRVPNSWFLGHRLVANVDGNVGTASFLTFVGSGSVVLKQDSPYLDWCARHLTAGEHYLPVARDLRDLVPVARAALAEPERAEAVVRAGRRFAARFLTGAAVDVYTLALLERYAAVAPPAVVPESGFVAVSPQGA